MEQVTHPTHYNLDGRKECWDEMDEVFGAYDTIAFCLLSAFKYLYRAGEKEDYKTDISKANVFIGHATEIIEKEALSTYEINHFYDAIEKLKKMLAEKENKEG